MKLSSLIKSGKRSDIVVKSFEGDIYLSFLSNGQSDNEAKWQCIEDASGEPMRARSLFEMKEKLHGVNMGSCKFVFETPYEEMIRPSTEDVATASHQQLKWS